MGRLKNIANAGYYPWPEEHYGRVAGQLVGPGGRRLSPSPAPRSGVRDESRFDMLDVGPRRRPWPGWMLDPCAGTGTFARYLAGSFGLGLATIEINRERGEQCRAVSDHHLTCDALEVECGCQQFAFLWSNPPYMRDAEARLEWRFLRRYRDALAPGGVLAYTIPGPTMRHDSGILRHLVRFYDRHRLYWLPEPNPYRQVLYLGVRRERGSDDPGALQDLAAILESGRPLLPEACADPLPIPALSRATIRLRGKEVDWEQIRREAMAGGVDLAEHMIRPEPFNTRTLLPPKKGHIVSVLAGGGVDHHRLGDDIIRGATRQAEVEELCEEEGVTITRTAYYPQIVTFNPQAGTWHIHEQGQGMEGYMERNATGLATLVQEQFQPLYGFDMSAVPADIRRIIHTLALSREPVPGKPRGLWPGQRHVLAALYLGWQSGLKSLVAVCQMGWGKSLLGAGAIAVNHAAGGKPAWFLTEAHLVDQMVDEVRQTCPWALVRRVDTIEEAAYFLRLGQDPTLAGKPRVAVVSNERMKNGCGWSAAVNRTQGFRSVLGTADDGPGSRRRVKQRITRYRCPDCGRLQVYGDGEREGALVVDDDEYFAAKPRACTYQVVRGETGTGREGCGAPLWQFSREVGGTPGKLQEGFARLGGGVVTYRGREAAGSYACRTGIDPVTVEEWIGHPPGGEPSRFDMLELDGATTVRHGLEVRGGQVWLHTAGHRPLAVVPPERPDFRYRDREYEVTCWQVDEDGTRVPRTERRIYREAYLPNTNSRPLPGLVRWPLVKWLRRCHPDQVGTLVVDEVHHYKGEGTDAGFALGDLIHLADRVLLMTGTLFGGKASSVFYTLLRTSPEFQRRFAYDEQQRFVERFGVLERKTIEKEPDHQDVGQTTLQTRRRTCVAEAPGVSPALISHFLGFTLFSSLSDLGVQLPDVEHRMLPVRLDADHCAAYETYRDACVRALIDARDEGVRLAGALLHTLRGYAVAPWRVEQLRDREGGVWAEAPNLEMVCSICERTACEAGCPGRERPQVQRRRIFAPERALLAEVQAQLARGRRVAVFVEQTRTRDVVTTRLIPLCEAQGLRAIFCDVDAQKRAEWIRKHGPFCDVMLAHPRAAGEGLNLVDFATCIFYEIPYSLFVFRQAPARLRRPTQAKKVEVIYLNVVDTIVAQALELMFEKLTAASVFRGESVEGALRAVTARATSFMAELIQRVVDRAEVTHLEELFARFNRIDAEADEFIAEYELASHDVVETASRRHTILDLGPVSGEQLSLF
jgi:hypothetical protein